MKNRRTGVDRRAHVRNRYKKVKIKINCENASYGGGICAERNAMTTALAQGHRKFKAIAVATELNDPGSPCGICRQFLSEFGEFKVR
ncbi:cytidine and deoxycytidylate deaminase zinc-binding region [Ancylostoma caninum]|uniref:Cytidine and deoxycytidylate deaminase zinc-binding region n=1 Tax=Ancylostoma caninum TaxID=29170 RepID=A0A368GQE5_ANCCA|nr:cytidine and deoxycytidylate deaminase zinc-binding region [Ancylostoma caninum]